MAIDDIKKQLSTDERKATTRAPTIAQGTRIKAVNVGRNDPCPCGSGKKFKKCCGR